MLEYLASGIVLGLAAGVAPGPLLALALGQALRFGTREGLKVAAAPLLTDVPIVALATLLVATAAGTAGGLLGAISLAGAAFVAYLGLETIRVRGVDAGRPDGAPAAAAFLAGFYACLVGAKMLIAIAAGRSGGRLRGRAYRAVMATLGGLLLVFAARLAVEGLRLLGVLTV
ncbi:MAG: LysE family translocator [Chloroflexota bacterium]